MHPAQPPRRPFTVSRRTFLSAAGVTLAATVGTAAAAAPATAAPTTATAKAAANGPTFPPTLTELQPRDAASVQALLAYDPATDPNARYMRSRVPLARRIDGARATQANPKLDPRPRITSLNHYYNQPLAGAPSLVDTRYGYDQHPYITRFAQYQDILGGWMGAQNLPNPGYVDAAHRNGTIALGIVFQPYISATPGAVPDFLARDAAGNYLIGDKLVDLAGYFGFDGYFLNIEGKTITEGQAADLAALFDAMHARARANGIDHFHLQIYDALWTDGSGEYENRFDAHNAGWVNPGHTADSMFINYAWPKNIPTTSSYHHDADYVTPSVALAKERSLDPFATLYFGLDIQEENDGRHLNALDYFASEVVPLNGDGAAVASLALFVQSDRTVQRTRDQLGDQAGDPAQLYPAIDVADRKFWSGAAQNPAVQPVPVHPSPVEAAAVDYVPRYGMANFVPERSVIGAAPFTTRFNTGQGDGFRLAGARAGARAWYHIGIQDVLPSWQWWTRDAATGETGGDRLLSADYEGGAAYNGGSCLRIEGRLGGELATEVRLYRTALDAGRALELSLLVKAVTAGAGDRLRFGLSYGDRPTATQWLSPVGAAVDAGEGWRRLTFRPRPRRGATVTALSIGAFGTGAAADFAVRVGELRVLDGALGRRPARPSGFRVDATSAGATGLVWQAAERGVWYYDVRTAGPAPQWLGRISGDAVVVEALPSGTRLTLVAVGFDGAESAPATLTVR
ncbi:hypothetical protein BIV57_11015 [Mangrovactinospora gilvigrisea]|uniref:Cytosolic endo-beta-N-acetylglucosaminidase TIM barrel domain-containing protein n=1 Tax=Mangrovactinospora gilvigrisea TaxID=1428644 RepID=A0A1J7CCT1_9ACTN|nr:hypothetical protein [Mangrovactinospora gilvigrisea]OIV37490.1 hypothetical protein BIV57_11015 [Mangrovactinospora gilvigrisea]